ncbi:glycosyltransferase family 39 protein [Fulvivirga ligni]|uniref:glycosyltransferase family 39 protein n=1 Tax=Fulvivirga ligni TaxID=2904246 RepID=UPI001F1CC2F3|nr:glycosyltransferase family 39 protein [Fulvivirga ligni]UII19851.1 glycosyltransferase family 39 protein [Fulvivirga ligni]
MNGKSININLSTLALLSLGVFWLIFVSYPSCYWFYIIGEIEDYSQFSTTVNHLFQDTYLNHKIDEYFLSASHFQFVKAYYIPILIAFLILNLLSLALMVRLIKSCGKLSFKAPSLSRKELLTIGSLLLVWLAYKVFLYYHFPLHIDEVFDYVYYSKKDILIRHTYQFTDGIGWANNHVFYTDLSHLLLSLGFPDKLAIRLPSIVAELILLICIFSWLQKKGLVKALFSAILVATSFWAGIYSIQGRSYYLMALFSVVSYILFEEYRTSHKTSQLLLLSFISILAFCTNKLFIIPFTALILYALIQYRSFRKTDFRQILLASSLLAILVGLFYFPVCLVSGWDKIIPRSFTKEPLQPLVLYMETLETMSVITNANAKAYLILLLPFISYLFLRKKYTKETKRLHLFTGLQLFMVIIFSLIMRTYIPFRALIYLNVIFTLLIGFIIYDLSGSHKKLVLTTCIIIMAANTAFNFKYTWLHRINQYIYDKLFYAQIDRELEIVKKHEPQHIFIQRDLHFHLFYTMLEFPDKTEVYDQMPDVEAQDIIISSDSTSTLKILVDSPIEDALILQRE